MTDQSRTPAAGEHQRFRVEGMDCGGCERKVEAAVARLDDVADVNANASVGTVDVVAEEDATPSSQAIEAAIRNLGYSLAPKDNAGASTSNAEPEPWWQTPRGGSSWLLASFWSWRSPFTSPGRPWATGRSSSPPWWGWSPSPRGPGAPYASVSPSPLRC